ncbi:MAG: VOC family protein [Candidatus Limnocylindria bacterium]
MPAALWPLAGMIIRLDHVVIAVRDLAVAIERYRSLGFEVQPGGRHVGLGTHNALIRFGLDYIELLAVHDEAEARRQNSRSAMLDFLERREGGLIGYAVATADIDDDARRLGATGLAAVGPFAMSRTRPDGRVLSWRLLIPEGLAWRRPWPFLIQWDAADADRLAWEVPGRHPNGATSVRAVRVLVADAARGREVYGRHLGLVEASGARSEAGPRYRLGGTTIELVTASGDPVLQRILADEGEGIHELVLATRDVAAAERRLGTAPADGARIAFSA